MYVIDDGTTMVGQAGRVHDHYEGRGIFSNLTRYLIDQARIRGCRRRMALVETTLNKYARSERFRATHREICSKLHYAGVITDTVRGTLNNKDDTIYPIKEINTAIVEDYIAKPAICAYLFPSKSLLLDHVPLEPLSLNSAFLPGRNVKFYSTVNRTRGGIYSGLLSAGSSYKSMHPPMYYTIGIFGRNPLDLLNHVSFHLRQAIQLTHEDCCIQIFVENGHIAQELCKVLISFAVQK